MMNETDIREIKKSLAHIESLLQRMEKSTPDVQDQERLGREKILVDKPALFCLARHFKTFYAQACAGVKADFTLPCVDCPKMTTCDKHWDDYILPLCDKAGVIVLFNSDVGRR